MSNVDLGSVLGGTGAVLSILSMIYTAINHKRIRGRCCGKEIDIELNIDSTTEPNATTAGATAPVAQPESPVATPRNKPISPYVGTRRVYPELSSY
jgi:hypothetical protein